ncbi:MAG: ImmA/IrrE family metallo-endopeptidase [bacterium]|nr:ImmA/IrrE family metallo-endopeptidase [bacterium]
MATKNVKQSLYLSVDRIRDKLGISHDARGVDIRSVAESVLNLEVRVLPFKTPGLHGIACLGFNGDPDIILLNSARNTIEQRFDFSHELYHCAYHRRAQQAMFSCYETIGKQQNPFAEWQANEAAAELVLPYRAFLPAIKARKLRDSHSIDCFVAGSAMRFCVTQQNVVIRLESLKYEIYQYLNGVPLEELEFLTRNEQERRGIRVESLLDFRKRIHRSPWDPRPQYMLSNDLTLRASIPDR